MCETILTDFYDIFGYLVSIRIDRKLYFIPYPDIFFPYDFTIHYNSLGTYGTGAHMRRRIAREL